MNKKTKILTIAFVMLSMVGCATASPGEAVFINSYKHRVVRSVPATHHNVTTVKVHHIGLLTIAEKDDLRRWYKNKQHRPHHRVNVVYVRN